MHTKKNSLHKAHQVNLHTHSWYCGHGTGELAHYVDAAINVGLTALGFSEHCPVPDGRWNNSRMAFEQLDTYMEECRALQASEPGVRILCGFECDHERQYVGWYQDRLLNSGFADYLAFGIHFLQGPDGRETYIKNLPSEAKWLHTYTDAYIDGLQSGTYAFGVHPDLFGMFYTTWDADAISCSRSIISCAAELGIPLEINGYGFRKPMILAKEGKRLQYPMTRFWELAATYDLPIIINSDAHDPADLDLRSVGAHEMAHEIGIKLSGWHIEGKQEGGTAISIARP